MKNVKHDGYGKTDKDTDRQPVDSSSLRCVFGVQQVTQSTAAVPYQIRLYIQQYYSSILPPYLPRAVVVTASSIHWFDMYVVGINRVHCCIVPARY